MIEILEDYRKRLDVPIVVHCRCVCVWVWVGGEHANCLTTCLDYKTTGQLLTRGMVNVTFLDGESDTCTSHHLSAVLDVEGPERYWESI